VVVLFATTFAVAVVPAVRVAATGVAVHEVEYGTRVAAFGCGLCLGVAALSGGFGVRFHFATVARVARDDDRNGQGVAGGGFAFGAGLGVRIAGVATIAGVARLDVGLGLGVTGVAGFAAVARVAGLGFGLASARDAVESERLDRLFATAPTAEREGVARVTRFAGVGASRLDVRI
jgi:F0F1-type ATP synthase membrane subunit c/vacuolar-type H+-ATPase subunit K